MTSVWGIDVSTKRIAVAAIGDTANVSQIHVAAEPGARRLSVAYAAIQGFVDSLANYYPPYCVFVESPAGKYVEPSLIHMVGITHAAVYGALERRYPHPVSVLPISVGEWKKTAVGHGNATKEQVMAWAMEQGHDPRSQDEADALAIATAGALMTDQLAA